VDESETAAEAAVREVEEETGGWGVRIVGMPSPSLPTGFPETHSLIPLPVWTTEIEVRADNHLAEPHVHADHMWVALADDA
jgi:8-oxo-dGTP pyrophosphatase MutT (NUDIX family)